MEDKKYSLLFAYAFFSADGSDGVHEDLCTAVTAQEGLAHARTLWPDADEYRISDRQIGSPYYFLFAKDRSPKEISKHIIDMEPQEISDLVSHLDRLNQ